VKNRNRIITADKKPYLTIGNIIYTLYYVREKAYSSFRKLCCGTGAEYFSFAPQRNFNLWNLLYLCLRIVDLGLKQKCIFQFSRKGENHAKMVRFSRNFANLRENLTKISRNKEEDKKDRCEVMLEFSCHWAETKISFRIFAKFAKTFSENWR
jgi:hypothetical protein